MGLKRRQAPSIRAKVFETHWYGDEHIDIDASNLLEWARNGDPDLLKPKTGKSLTVIKYRGLTEREHSQLPLEDGTGQALMARCYEACKYGLIGIEGEKIQRRKYPSGVVGLSNETLDDLCGIKAEIPLGVTIAAIYQAMGIEISDEDTDPRDTSLPIWLGGQILAATFRALKDGT